MLVENVTETWSDYENFVRSKENLEINSSEVNLDESELLEDILVNAEGKITQEIQSLFKEYFDQVKIFIDLVKKRRTTGQ